MKRFETIGIIGHTASGKTHLAVQLALQMKAEIISLDSRQVYRELNLGAGKDLKEYQVLAEDYMPKLVNITELKNEFHIDQFKEAFYEAYSEIQKAGRSSILCGGTGLYFDVLLNDRPYTAVPLNEGLRLQLEQKSLLELQALIALEKLPANFIYDNSTKKRCIRILEIADYLRSGEMPATAETAVEMKLFGCNYPVPQRAERIRLRLRQRLEQGMLEEVQRLLDSGISAERLIRLGLEYKWLTLFCVGEISYSDAIQNLEIGIIQFAKRQMTFFRRLERQGHAIHWLPANESVEDQVDMMLASLDNSHK